MSLLRKLGLGCYPKEYKPEIHGVYDPARYYGPKDKAFLELKLNEVAGWIGRRNKHPLAFAQWTSRVYWQWAHLYVLPKRTGIAPFFQLAFAEMLLFYYFNWGRIKHQYHYKYH